MIRAVVDTNILASGSIDSSRSPGLVLLAWANLQFNLVTSEHILHELERTLSKPYFRNVPGSRPSANVVAEIRRRADVVTNLEPIERVATHPEDDLVLATAVSGNAVYIVTGDRQLLKLGEFQDIQILTAAEFLFVLAET